MVLRGKIVKKKTIAGAGVGALILVAMIGSCGGEETPTPTPTATRMTGPAPVKEPPVAAKMASGVGDTVKDGKFSFTVTKVKCGIPSFGDALGTAKAQGQFCKVSMTVKNHSGEPNLLSDDDQYAFDAAGNKFSADVKAGIYDSGSQMFLEEVNPGNSVKGNVYFDVPKGTKLVKLELHDSMFSGGANVVLP